MSIHFVFAAMLNGFGNMKEKSKKHNYDDVTFVLE